MPTVLPPGSMLERVAPSPGLAQAITKSACTQLGTLALSGTKVVVPAYTKRIPSAEPIVVTAALTRASSRAGAAWLKLIFHR